MISNFSKASIPPSKGVAFTIHLVLSLLVFSTLVAMMLLFWFPGELFILDGGWQGLKLVAMVDLVLGPALTLFLYKPGKPKLALDMSMIAAVQIIALGFGFYTTYHQRTVAIVYSERSFSTVSAKDQLESAKQLIALDIQPKPIAKPGLMSIPTYLTPDPEPGQYGKFLEDILNGYPSPRTRLDQYVAISDRPDELEKGVLSEEDLAKKGILGAVTAALDEKQLKLEDTDIINFNARYATGVVLFDRKQMKIVDYVPSAANAQDVAEADI